MPIDTGRPFLNPYNFVDVDLKNNRGKEGKKSSDSIKKDKRFSGELKCHIKTKTPLFVPESTPYEPEQRDENESDKHKYYKL